MFPEKEASLVFGHPTMEHPCEELVSRVFMFVDFIFHSGAFSVFTPKYTQKRVVFFVWAPASYLRLGPYKTWTVTPGTSFSRWSRLACIFPHLGMIAVFTYAQTNRSLGANTPFFGINFPNGTRFVAWPQTPPTQDTNYLCLFPLERGTRTSTLIQPDWNTASSPEMWNPSPYLLTHTSTHRMSCDGHFIIINIENCIVLSLLCFTASDFLEFFIYSMCITNICWKTILLCPVKWQ